ncbi:hypothetical protein [Undibacterium sp. Di24W]|uniref:hypothetical protein n=1 Tax=Undibacterium sp. Di24W TaxID=3413033 RepID=UPI003BF26BDA
MDDLCFDKSEKGKDELATRRYQLQSKLRALLVMVDGKQTVSALLKKVAGLGLTADSFAVLLEQGYIVQHQVERAAHLNEKDTVPISKSRVLCVPTPARIVMIHNFFNEMIQRNLGLRGFGIQLKVERADTVADFLELGETLVEAIQKSKGSDAARQTQAELDSLLYDVVEE